MIDSKKGVESFPFFLFLTLTIAAFVLMLGFYQLGVFTGFSNDRTLTDNYQNLINAMDTLRSTSDYGSFTRIKFEIPSNYNITFSNETNTIKIAGKINLNNTLDFTLLCITNATKKCADKSITLNPGKYELVVYYGNVTPDKDKEPYEIFFI
jgi:hypothetical protein